MKNKIFQVRGNRRAIQIHVNTDNLPLFLSQFENYMEENKDFFKNGNLEILGIDLNSNTSQIFRELESKYNINIKIISNMRKSSPTLFSTNYTNYHLKTIRSGQRVTYEGDVVVIGDVNSGGEIVATGNVIITGTLRGKAHCGYPNDYNCFIIANKMVNTQLIIGEKIATYGSSSLFGRDTKIAYIKDDQILVTSLSQWQRRGE